MKTLILNVDYTNGTGVNGKGSFWADSYIKNTEITQKENETIHQTVKRAIEEIDYAEMSYKGKPQSNMYVDLKNGEARCTGYVYRVKHYISDRSNDFSGYAYFDAWVQIKQSCEVELTPMEE